LIGSTIIVVSILAGLPWGATGVAASYSLVFVFVVTPLLFWFVGRSGPVRTIDFYRTIAPTAYATVGVLAALLLLRRWVEFARPLSGLLASFAITVAVTLLLLLVLPRGRRALSDLKLSLLLLRAGRKPAARV
jgi:hypothetical protein